MKVACPGERQVMSGGGFAGGPFRGQRLVASVPFDSDDPGTVPDDGWRVRRVSVDNLTRKKRRIAAHAICTSSGGLSYVAQGFTATDGVRTHVEPACDSAFVVGGVVSHGIPYRRATLVASRVPSGVGGA